MADVDDRLGGQLTGVRAGRGRVLSPCTKRPTEAEREGGRERGRNTETETETETETQRDRQRERDEKRERQEEHGGSLLWTTERVGEEVRALFRRGREAEAERWRCGTSPPVSGLA